MVDPDGKITREWMPFFRNLEKLINAPVPGGPTTPTTPGLTLAQVLAALGSIATKSADDYTPSTAFWGGVDYAAPLQAESPEFFDSQQLMAEKDSPLFFEGQQVMPQETASPVLMWLT